MFIPFSSETIQPEIISLLRYIRTSKRSLSATSFIKQFWVTGTKSKIISYPVDLDCHTFQKVVCRIEPNCFQHVSNFKGRDTCTTALTCVKHYKCIVVLSNLLVCKTIHCLYKSFIHNSKLPKNEWIHKNIYSHQLVFSIYISSLRIFTWFKWADYQDWLLCLRGMYNNWSPLANEE